MMTTPELMTALQRERERTIEMDRMACQAACASACCNPTLLGRAARVLRGTAGHLKKAN